MKGSIQQYREYFLGLDDLPSVSSAMSVDRYTSYAGLSLVEEVEKLRRILTNLVQPDEFDQHPLDFAPDWHEARAALLPFKELP